MSCGVCDHTANLTTLCHCFEFGWSLESECRGISSTLLPYAKWQCGADWYDSEATDLATINQGMEEWEAGYVLTYALAFGSMYFVDAHTLLFRIFKEQHPMKGLALVNFVVEVCRGASPY